LSRTLIGNGIGKSRSKAELAACEDAFARFAYILALPPPKLGALDAEGALPNGARDADGREICRAFRNQGSCRLGDACAYAHSAGTTASACLALAQPGRVQVPSSRQAFVDSSRRPACVRTETYAPTPMTCGLLLPPKAMPRLQRTP
jgi:hypothetical protein